jgi:DNA-binding NarL/FixJ family response regulator
MPASNTFISILISDDHDMILDALELLLQKHEQYKIIARANTIISLKENLNRHRPDILILDLNFNKHNILDDLESIKALSRNTKIIILSSYDAPFLVKEAFHKGADGYLLKDTGKEELLETLDHVWAGKKVIGDSVNYIDTEKQFADAQFIQQASLSGREMQIVELLIQDKTEQEIAEIILISKHTVHDHKKNIFRKLRIRSNAELIKYAFEHGWVK